MLFVQLFSTVVLYACLLQSESRTFLLHFLRVACGVVYFTAQLRFRLTLAELQSRRKSPFPSLESLEQYTLQT